MPTQTFFLEDWLRTNSSTPSPSPSPSPSSSARAIIQSWSDLRDSLNRQSFQPHHLQSLQTLLNSQTSLHVADPQAKLLLSILSSPNLSPPPNSHPLFLKLLYIWLRKSSKPFASLVESAVSVVTALLSTQFDGQNACLVVCYGVLVLGAISAVPILSQGGRRACLEGISRVMEEHQPLINLCEGVVPEVIAGIGYALSSCEIVYFGRIFSSLFGIWRTEGGVRASLAHGLMILHLFEWVVLGFIASGSFKKIECVCDEIVGICRLNDVRFGVVMAASGVLRALNKLGSSYSRPGISRQIKNSLEECVEFVARDLISKTGNFSNLDDHRSDRLVLQCISMGVTRSGLDYCRAPLVSCLATALLVEIFPLRSFYRKFAEYTDGSFAGLGLTEVKEQTDGVLFKEAGLVTRSFCNQYSLADEENKRMVENMVWEYCQDLYSGHQRVALLLRNSRKDLLDELEKIAEACFHMIVIFASVVTKHVLNTNCSPELKMDVSVRILVSFSCIEYFRGVRLPEYTDTILGIAVCVQENEPSCVSFIESIPSYDDLTKRPGSVGLGTEEHVWSKNDVQTARILFYLRVIPTCIERVPSDVFRKLVAPIMFLYMGHPDGKVARASHSVFVAFMASGKDSNMDDRIILKEQLVFYYVQRALEGYPGITPFEGMASGVASLVRHLPAGNPGTFYCINSLVEKAKSLCGKAVGEDAAMWKDWQGDSEASKKVVELLLRLLSLVDIQVLPTLMKLLAQFTAQLPRDGQNMVLDEIHSLVAESDDVTRKPIFVSWVQSLSFLCSQTTNTRSTTLEMKRGGSNASGGNADVTTLSRISASL